MAIECRNHCPQTCTQLPWTEYSCQMLFCMSRNLPVYPFPTTTISIRAPGISAPSRGLGGIDSLMALIFLVPKLLPWPQGLLNSVTGVESGQDRAGGFLGISDIKGICHPSVVSLSGHCGKLVSSLLSSFVDSLNLTWGFPGGSYGKESACNAGDLGSIPGFGRCPREGNGCPLQYSCLENSVDSRAWQATVHGVAQSQTWLSTTGIHGNQIIQGANPDCDRQWHTPWSHWLMVLTVLNEENKRMWTKYRTHAETTQPSLELESSLLTDITHLVLGVSEAQRILYGSAQKDSVRDKTLWLRSRFI